MIQLLNKGEYMIISIAEASKRFNISRSKLYRMRDSGDISFSKRLDGSMGIEVSELSRVFGGTSHEHEDATKRDSEKHNFETENLYLKKEVEILTKSLKKSEERLDQFIALTQEQNKRLLLTYQPDRKSLWWRLLGK
jgi:hypothetical protein